jgi:metal transporter CNNM
MLQVKAVMTQKEKVYMLSADARLSFKTISEIFKTGFSRIPVYGSSRDDIVGILMTKDLIFIDPEDETPVKNFVQIFGRSLQVMDSVSASLFYIVYTVILY